MPSNSFVFVAKSKQKVSPHTSEYDCYLRFTDIFYSGIYLLSFSCLWSQIGEVRGSLVVQQHLLQC